MLESRWKILWLATAFVAALLMPFAVAGAKGKPSGGGAGGGGGGSGANPAIACAHVLKSGQCDLVVMNADGSSASTLVANVGNGNWHHVTWSPDGSRLAFNGTDSAPGIDLVNVDGSGRTEVLSTSAAPGALAWSPVASPDGKEKIAFASGDLDLYVVNTDGTGLVNLTNTSSRYEFDPTWSPDGTKIAAIRQGGNGGAGDDLVVYDLGTDASGNLTVVGETSLVVGVSGSPLLGKISLQQPNWSRNGTLIAVTADPSGQGQDIFLVDPASPADATNLTDSSGADDWHPTWSPDDSRLAFRVRSLSKGQSKNDGLYSISVDGTGLTLLAKGDYWNPAWRR